MRVEPTVGVRIFDNCLFASLFASLLLFLAGCSGPSDGSGARSSAAEDRAQASTETDGAADRSTEGSSRKTETSPRADSPKNTRNSSGELGDPVWKDGKSDWKEGNSEGPLRRAPIGFDETSSGYRATVPGLGDVELRRDGTLRIRPTGGVRGGEFVRPDWRYETELARFGREGAEVELDGANPTVQNPEGGALIYRYAEIDTDLVYENRSSGLKQALRIDSAPPGEGALRIAFDVGSDFDVEIRDGGRRALVQYEGRTVFAWTGLAVRDEVGERVPSRMALEEGRLVYRIRDAGAEYPLHVDPLGTDTGWDNDSGEDESGSNFGQSVTARGDFNGNGFADLLVGQVDFGTQSNTPIDRGRALMYLADSGGISSSADWVLEGAQTGQGVGRTVQSLGDVDGDGVDDFAVGGVNYDDTPNDGSDDDNGRIRVFLGDSMVSKSSTPQQNSNDIGSAVWSYIGPESDSEVGLVAPGVGDVNCDGNLDIAIGTPSESGFSGAVRVFNGSSSSPYFSNSPDWSKTGSDTDTLGSDVAMDGNVNDDTSGGNACDDLLVGSRGFLPGGKSGNFWGRAQLFLGSSSGPSNTADWSDVGETNGANFGSEVDILPNANGDNFADVAVSAPFHETGGSDKGKAYLYHGQSGPPPLPNSADWTDTGTQVDERFGQGIAGGDVNSDGFTDLLVGANKWSSSSGNEEGRAVLYRGTSSGLQNTTAWSDSPNRNGANFGVNISAGGDTNGDGIGDVAVSAQTWGSAGRVFIYEGSAQCFINGTFYDDGDKNPNNTCEICDISSSTTSWTADTSAQGNSCTPSDQCIDPNTATCDSNGNCTGQPKTCDDGLVCTSDSCDSSTGCVFTVQNGCAIDGSCFAAGATNPNNDCEECIPSQAEKSWSPKPSNATCDNGQFCTVDDTCDGAGNCVAGDPRDCSDTIGVNGTCADSVRCNEARDQCNPRNPKNGGSSCDDGNACTSSETCQRGFCSGTTTTCSNPCKECDPATGMCSVDKPDGTSCNSDGDICTLEVCQSGQCTMDSQRSCDDGNPCTENNCDPQNGCQNPTKSAGAQCGEPMCNENGNLVQAPVCDSSGNCQNPSVIDCGRFTCSNPGNASATCLDACSSDADCKEGNFCLDRPDDQDGDQECYDNRPPEADAGMDQSRIPAGSRVNLNGSASSDPDEDELTFEWSLADSSCPGGETSDTEAKRSDIQSGELWDPTAESPSFTMPSQDCTDEVLQFELVVDDGEFESEPDRVEIAYGDCGEAPVAEISRSGSGAPQWGSTLTFDGTDSRTGCGNSLSYSWTFQADDPSTAPELAEPEGNTSETYELELPDTCREAPVRYEIELQVNDGIQTSPVEAFPLVVPANGPCQGDGGPPADAGDAGLDPDVSDSGCSFSAGSEGAPQIPVSVVGALLLGGLLRIRRRSA